MRISYKTVSNTRDYNKPNEDRLFVDTSSGVYIVMDGVSRDKEQGIYPVPSPSAEVTDIFIKEISAFIIDEINKGTTSRLEMIFKGIEIGNEAIRNFNISNGIKSFPAGTVGIIAIIYSNRLYYAYIGDCVGRLLCSERSIEFTECQTEKIHQHIKEFTTDEIRNDICNNICHPYAYGVLDGNPNALNFIRMGSIGLNDIQAIILCTDGAEELINNIELNTLNNFTADEIYEHSSHGKQFNSDDKTLIKIDLCERNK